MEATSSPIDLLVTGGTVVTVDKDRRVLRDGAVAVKDGRIVDVGDTQRLIKRYADALEVMDVAGGIVTPGLVDAHVHLSQHLGRSVLPDTWPEHREHEHWLPYWQLMSEQDSELSAILACMEMVQAGSTCFSDMSGRFAAETQATAAGQIGIRGLVSETVWDIPPHPSVATGDTEECLASLSSLLDRFPYEDRSLVWSGVGLAGMGTASDELLQLSKRLADERGAVMYMHQSFGVEDTAQFSKRGNGVSAVEHLGDLGVLGPNLHLVHMIRNSIAEVEMLAETGTGLVHCPSASLRWGMGASRSSLVNEALGRGVRVALGSDSGNYSDFLDIGKQMYLAATIHREASGETRMLTAETALEMATVNGAKVLGVEADIGSLEVGKKADLVVHSSRRASAHPVYDAVRSLVYSMQSSAVDTVIIDGEIVLRNGRFTRIDEDEVLGRVDEAAWNLSKRMGWTTPHAWEHLGSVPQS